jgi:methionine-rich copper-binding protein CopC
LLGALALYLVTLSSPAPARAHAELVSSQPANGATVAAGFAGPLVLTYDEALAQGSHAELINSGGQKILDAAIDPADRRRLVFTLTGPLEPGTFTIQWTSVAADRDVQRGQLGFTVAAPTPSPSAPPTMAPTPSPTAAPTATAIPTATVQPSPSPTPTPSPAAASAIDVVLPIVAALAFVAIGGLYLLRRGRGAG